MEAQDIIQIAKQTKYPIDAFIFIKEGLDFTITKLHGPGDNAEDEEASRHISGQELCHGLRNYAIEQYGLMARTVLRRWNICASEDFGNLVFIMVEAGMLSKTDDDSIDDFVDVFKFADAFTTELTLTENS